jgi:DTW domain-containing protein YfiP
LDVSRLRLVVLDATWRKSRLMLLQNPMLQSLPRLALSDVPESQYVIRNAHQAHQLSTLEATTYALMELEKTSAKPNDSSALLHSFAQFNEQQIGFGVLNKLR